MCYNYPQSPLLIETLYHSGNASAFLGISVPVHESLNVTALLVRLVKCMKIHAIFGRISISDVFARQKYLRQLRVSPVRFDVFSYSVALMIAFFLNAIIRV